MTDEALSALLDGECSPAELDHLLEAMERDPALKARYSRMCLARDCLRGGAVKAVHPDFASRVLAALDHEPASTVVAFRPRRRITWQPLAGLAAAAALAAVALLVVRPESPLAPKSEEVADVKDDRHWTELDAANARQLNSYVRAYSQSRAEQGVGGTVSQARYAPHPAQAAHMIEQEPEQVR